MKIGIVCYPTFGGSGVMATELGLALAKQAHEVHFIAYQQPVRLDVFSPNIYFHEVNVPKYPLFDYPPYETALASTLFHVVEHYGLDLLHVHYAIPHASSAYFARQMLRKSGKDIPFITTLHGTDITLVGRESNYACVVAFSINESNAVTAVSENLREETLRFFKISKEIQVIPNFVDNNRFFQHEKNHFKQMLAPEGEKIMVHVSNFRKVKRVDDVIQIFAKVRKQIPVKLIMVGDGPERQNIEELSRNLGVSNDVRFLGKQDKMEEIFNVSDIFLLPSQYESFGLAALEAMACGVPVISSNAGGIPEINIHAYTGFLSEVGDVKAMATHTLNLLQDECLLLQFKQNALKQAEKFSMGRVVQQYESLYTSVLNRTNSLK